MTVSLHVTAVKRGLLRISRRATFWIPLHVLEIYTMCKKKKFLLLLVFSSQTFTQQSQKSLEHSQEIFAEESVIGGRVGQVALLSLCPLFFIKFLFFTTWQPFKSYEKCFLFHLKSCFRSRDIQIFVFSSSPYFSAVSHCLRG